MTERVTVRVLLPGRFCAWFAGTGIVQGTDIAPAARRMRQAWRDSQPVPAGNGFYRVLQLDRELLHLLHEYADYCVEANRDEPDYAERSAAHLLMRRVEIALDKLDA